MNLKQLKLINEEQFSANRAEILKKSIILYNNNIITHVYSIPNLTKFSRVEEKELKIHPFMNFYIFFNIISFFFFSRWLIEGISRADIGVLLGWLGAYILWTILYLILNPVIKNSTITRLGVRFDSSSGYTDFLKIAKITVKGNNSIDISNHTNFLDEVIKTLLDVINNDKNETITINTKTKVIYNGEYANATFVKNTNNMNNSNNTTNSNNQNSNNNGITTIGNDNTLINGDNNSLQVDNSKLTQEHREIIDDLKFYIENIPKEDKSSMKIAKLQNSIEGNIPLKSKILGAIKDGSIEFILSSLDNPIFNSLVAVYQSLTK
jgi:hypothetical protein